MNNNTAIINTILKNTPLEPEDILYIMHLNKISVRTVANDLRMTSQNVSNCIHGAHSSLKVASHIAYKTNTSIKSLFGNRYDRIIKAKHAKKVA